MQDLRDMFEHHLEPAGIDLLSVSPIPIEPFLECAGPSSSGFNPVFALCDVFV
jgi:hypothetical protein